MDEPSATDDYPWYRELERESLEQGALLVSQLTWT